MENAPDAVSGLPQPPKKANRLLQAALMTGLLVVVLLLTMNVWLLNRHLEWTVTRSRERAFWQLCHSGATPEQRTQSFLQLVADGNTEWKSARLERLTLTGTDLQQARLSGARFSYCNLTQVDFRQAVLDRSGVDNSELTETDFSGADMKNASLFKSVLKNCSFRNTELQSATLEQATAVQASFVAAKMGDAFLAMADLSGADFTGADLSGANLEAALLRGADLALTNLYDANLTDTDLTNTNWWRSRGLTTEQLDDLTLRFPPDPSASESRQRDFTIWLQQRVGQK